MNLNTTEEQDILNRLIAGETVRTIKTAMKIGAEKIQKVREANIDKIPEKIRTRTRTKSRTRTTILEPHDYTTRIFFTYKEKKLAVKMFREVISQRAIKITDEDEYQKLIDKITGA